MQTLLILLSSLMISPAHAVQAADLKMLKSAQGFYVLESKGLKENQKRICLEGDLEFKESEGVLLLGGTPLAVDITPTKHNDSSEEQSDGCEEKTFSKISKQVLHFESALTCPADKMKNQIQREIQFKQNALTYKQINIINGDKVEVECKLKKSIQKSSQGWKLDPPVEVVEEKD